MRLIDADVFESVLDFADSDVCEESPDGHCDFGFSRENIRELLRDIPAIDAVPVVRCRECKNYVIVDEFEDCKRYMCLVNHFSYLDNDGDNQFCSYGERRRCCNEP